MSGDADDGVPTVIIVIAIIIATPVVVFVAAVALSTFLVSTGSTAAPPETPSVTFETGYEQGSYTLTHNGGEPIDAKNLTIVVNGEDTGTWADRGDSGEVSAGDSLILTDVSQGDSILIEWTGIEQGTPLMSDTVPPSPASA